MKKLKDLRINYQKLMETLQMNWKTLLFTSLVTIVLMIGICIAVFFMVIKSQEQVMVPNIVGKPLEEALMEMQEKELYPKLQTRYSNTADEKGFVLEQNPPAGSIVKAGRRINLIVSKGIVLDRIGDYVGQKLDDVRISLQTLFSGTSVPLIKIPDAPMFKADPAEPGTILEQDPPPNTSINQPVTLSLVVSSGSVDEMIKIPHLIGLSLNDALLQISRSKMIWDFTSRLPEGDEKPGTVVDQVTPILESIKNEGTEEIIEEVPVYSHSKVTLAIPEEITGGNRYGILHETLPNYPYALNLQLDVIQQDGEKYTIVTFKHNGGDLTIPYAVPQFSVLVLSVQGKEIYRTSVD